MSDYLRDLIDKKYIPFGSQYYRAPSPRPEEWDHDLKLMSDMGFNMVKYWVQWRWNHPEEDRFYFDDIDQLMDLADQYGLRVMLNTIVDVAPVWVYQKWPDASMLTLDGRRIGPQTQPHRQIGGLGLCFNHEPAMDQMLRFLETTAERYREHPALDIFNFGSEPELTSSMSEMRLYADDAREMGDMLCYCDRCQSAFKNWLRNRYTTIDTLNLRWNRNYQSFDDAEVPRTRNTFNDIVDWRMFFVDTLGENVRRRFEVVGEVDGGKHPLMCHHVFIQGFPVTSTANDPWNVGRYGDLHGITQMDDPMMCDILRSCARGKPIISAEMLMLYGYTLDLPKPIDANDIKRNVFVGIAANLKGFVFWQFRPETLGREAPAWGLTQLDGAETPWLRSFAQVNEVLQRNASFLLEATPPSAEVAILYNPENQVFAWAATSNEKTATDSLLGMHRALYEHNINVDFIHLHEIENGLLDNYRVLLAPFPYYLSETLCSKVRDWVERGGILITEGYFGGWFVEEGRHHTTIPGYGMHEVFKVRQTEAKPAADHEFVLYDGIVRKSKAFRVQPGLTEPLQANGFVLGRSFDPTKATWDSRKGPGLVEMTLTKDLPFLGKGAKIYGSFVREISEIQDAEVIAQFEDGKPAITIATYGKGKAVWIGTYVAMPFYRWEYPSNGAVIAALVEHTGALSPSKASGESKVRVDVLTRGEECMVILRNLEGTRIRTTVEIPLKCSGSLQEQFSGEILEPHPSRSGVTFLTTLDPEEVKVYRG